MSSIAIGSCIYYFIRDLTEMKAPSKKFRKQNIVSNCVTFKLRTVTLYVGRNKSFDCGFWLHNLQLQKLDRNMFNICLYTYLNKFYEV